MWAETSIPQFLHADEAAKHLGDALHRDRGEMNISQHVSQKVSRFVAKLFYWIMWDCTVVLDNCGVKQTYIIIFCADDAIFVCAMYTLFQLKPCLDYNLQTSLQSFDLVLNADKKKMCFILQNS